MARRLRLRLEQRLNRLESAVSKLGPTGERTSSPGEMESVLASLIEALGRDQVQGMLPEDLRDHLRPLLD